MAAVHAGVDTNPLYAHQCAALNGLFEDGVRGLLVAHSMGRGKTTTAVVATDLLRRAGNPRGALVVLPLAVVPTFVSEHRRVLGRLRGTLKRTDGRKVRAASLTPALLDQHSVTLVGFRKFHQALGLHPGLCDGRPVVIDEAHYLRNPDGVTLQRAVGATRRASHVILLTGTPAYNRLHDFANTLSLLLPAAKQADVARAADMLSSWGANPASIRRALQLLLDPSVRLSYVGKHAAADPRVARTQLVVEHVTMSREHSERVLDVMASQGAGGGDIGVATRAFLRQLGGAAGQAALPAALAVLADPARDRQLVQRAKAYLTLMRMSMNVFEPGAPAPVQRPKVNRLLHLLGQHPAERVVVFSYFHSYGIAAVADAITTAQPGRPLTSFPRRAELREQAIDTFNAAGPGKVMLITSSASHGITLRNVDRVILLEPFWHEQLQNQVIARVARPGAHDNPNRAVVPVHLLVCRMDQAVVGHGVPAELKLSVDERLVDVSARKAALENLFTEQMKHAHAVPVGTVCDVARFAPYTADRADHVTYPYPFAAGTTVRVAPVPHPADATRALDGRYKLYVPQGPALQDTWRDLAGALDTSVGDLRDATQDGHVRLGVSAAHAAGMHHLDARGVLCSAARGVGAAGYTDGGGGHHVCP